ncbi:MAG: crotonase/enoyl-CoA hydratase family protein [Acidimicrobiales bacterium]|nr:crotonase/enoyl-CoA hydratase family protein [Acidimicrobiales bacterium]
MPTIDVRDRIIIEIDGGVADVRMNRPDKLNALDGEMFAALVEAGDMLRENPEVRAVVLSGNGRSFCAGLDFSRFQEMAEGPGSSDADEQASGSGSVARITGPMPGRITHMGQQAVWTWQEMDQPVIAAVTGHALGGGCQLALGADIRIVHPESVMSVLEIRWGLVPDMSLSQILPRLVGFDVAKELYFTGRMIGGAEAVEMGLATRTSDDPLTSALDLAREIAGKNPDAIRRAKKLVNQYGNVDAATSFANEREYIGQLIGSPNQVEAVAAFFQKRDPQFRDVGSSGIPAP